MKIWLINTIYNDDDDEDDDADDDDDDDDDYDDDDLTMMMMMITGEVSLLLAPTMESMENPSLEAFFVVVMLACWISSSWW